MRIRLSFGPITLNIELEDEWLGVFLDAYFRPFFQLEKDWAANAVASIHVHDADPGRATEGEEILVDGSGGFLACTGVVMRQADPREVRMLPMDVHVAMDAKAGEVHLTGTTSDRLMVPLLRVIEDIIMIEVEKAGGIAVHASGVQLEGKAVLAIGSKRAGKTSLLIQLLRNHVCSKLCNDIAVLWPRDGRVVASGWPSFLKIEPGTMASYPELAPWFPAHRADILDTPEQLWSGKEEKMVFYPRHGAEILGATVEPEADVDTLLFPRFHPAQIDVFLWKDADKLRDLIVENLQGSLNEKHPNWHGYNEVTPRQAVANAESLVPLLASQASTYSLRWAPSLRQLIEGTEALRGSSRVLQAARQKTPPGTQQAGFPLPPRISLNHPSTSIARCAGGVVLNDKGEVAIGNQRGTSWSLPKGHVGDGEDQLTAARREIREETGLRDLQLVNILGSYERTAIDNEGNEDTTERKIIHIYLFRTLHTHLRSENNANPNARWVRLDDVAAQLTHPRDREFFGGIVDHVRSLRDLPEFQSLSRFRDAGLEARTRAVFHEHHITQAEDELTFQRLVGLISTDYFGVSPGFFRDKRVFDMSCGSNANASYAFLSLGAHQVTCADLGTDWMDVAQSKLRSFGERYSLHDEDLMSLSFSDGEFDFVHCAGALHHTRCPRQGFAELARVTALHGVTFITIMGTGNGILYPFVNALREKYRNDNAFRSLVDELSADRIAAFINWLMDERERQEGVANGEREMLASLFDGDFVLTIKDRLQAPTYHGFAFREAEIRNWFEEEGYRDVRRITRYTKGFRNLRRFLAPLYYHYDHLASRLLFGDGYIQMMGVKR